MSGYFTFLIIKKKIVYAQKKNVNLDHLKEIFLRMKNYKSR
jgi:hypothetical protein